MSSPALSVRRESAEWRGALLLVEGSAEGAAKLEVLDAQGKVIRALTSEQKKRPKRLTKANATIRRNPFRRCRIESLCLGFALRAPVKIPAAIYDGGNNPSGPPAMPGKYSVRLTVAGKSATQPLEIVMDPRVKTSAADLQKQFDLLLKLRDRQEALNRAVLGIRDLRNQLQSIERRFASSDSAKSVVTSAADLRKKLTAIEEELIQVNATASEDEANYPTRLNSKLSYVNGVTDSADTAPTPAEEAVFADLTQQLESS